MSPKMVQAINKKDCWETQLLALLVKGGLMEADLEG